MSYSAEQLLATGPKNQLVMGLNGQQAVLNVEGLGQISVVNVPDPGTAKGTDFVLTNSAKGGQTINGNLTVNGSIKTSSGDGPDLINGDLVFSHAADRQIRFDAASTGKVGANLSIVGNESTDKHGGDITITPGKSDTKNGGDLTLNGGQGAGGGGSVFVFAGTAGGAITILSGAGENAEISINSRDADDNTGAISVYTGASASGNSGVLNIFTNDGAVQSGDIQLYTGTAKTGSSGNIDIYTGTGITGANSGSLQLYTSNGDSAGPIFIGPGVASVFEGSALNLSGGSASGGTSNGGDVLITTGQTTGGVSGNFTVEMGSHGGSGGSLKLGSTGPIPNNITVGQAGMTGTTFANQFAYASKTGVITSSSGKTPAVTDSGKVFLVDTTGGPYNITLPSASLVAGVRFTFINKVPVQDVSISGVAGKIKGLVSRNGVVPIASSGANSINFISSGVQGDRIEMVYDGDSWSTFGFSAAAGGMTFT